jgi:hypothetical protein
MFEYSLALFAHVLVVVYLLGADLGRLYLARVGTAENIGLESLQLAARGVLWLSSATNLALVLILPAGISLGAALGAYKIMHPAYFYGTWAVAGVWALISISADRVASRALRITDVVFRLLLAPGFIYDGVIVFTGTSETVDAKWLASKIALYGLLIFMSVPMRWVGFGLRTALASNDVDGIQKRLAWMNVPILLGWIVILLAVWFGVAKPF